MEYKDFLLPLSSPQPPRIEKVPPARYMLFWTPDENMHLSPSPRNVEPQEEFFVSFLGIIVFLVGEEACLLARFFGVHS